MEKHYCCGKLLAESDRRVVCYENACMPILEKYLPVTCRSCGKQIRIYKKKDLGLGK